MTNNASEPSRLVIGGLLFAACVPYFLMLGTPPLWDANEPLYAQPPKEVLEWEQGDFWAPTWNGKTYWAHPPLSTWITVPFYAYMGSTELAGRLPMAIAAVLTILATYSLGARYGGRRIGLLAALVLAATPKFWLFSRQLAGDVYLVALLTWAFALALPAVSGDGGRRRLWLAHVLVGIGFLAKGPVILVLYGGGLFFAWSFARERERFSALHPGRSLLVIGVIGLAWFVYMQLRFPVFFGEHFGHYHGGRFIGTIGQRGWSFYPIALLGDAQPWITLLPFGLVAAWRARDGRVVAKLPWAVIVWTVVFFTLSAGKRNVYLLPIYPFVALAVAPVLLGLWRGAHGKLARAAGFLLALTAFLAAACVWMLRVHEPGLLPEIAVLFGVLLAAGIALAVCAGLGVGRYVAGTALGALLALELATALSFPALARFRPVPTMAARIQLTETQEAPEPAIIYRASVHSLNFYLGRPTRVAGSREQLLDKLGGAPEAYVLCPAHRAGDLLDEPWEYDVREILRRPYLVFQFKRSVLGREPTTRDLLLFHVTRRESASTGGR